MHPTILIGLDGATFTVLDALIADGLMPHLAAFQAGGVRAELASTPHPLTPPAWTTVMTGREPGGHGIFDFLKAEVRDGAAFFTLNDSRDIRAETIWSIVSRHGGRSTSLNFPLMAPPPAGVAGSIVPGLLSWRHLRRNVAPPALYDELKALPGFDPRALSWDFDAEAAVFDLPEAELEPWIAFHIGRERQWFGVLKHLMASGPADLTAVMFDGVDKLQHACWRLLDPDLAPASPEGLEARLVGLCRDYFRQVDDFLGAIVGSAGPSARVFLVSDHGFGPCSRSFRVNTWLHRRGYLEWAHDPAGRPRRKAHFVHLDWARTTAYAPSAATNGICIRVAERPDDGGVPAEDYGRFREELVGRLSEVRDPESGRPFFRAILRREGAFPGPHAGRAPDLTLVPWDHGLVSVLDVEPEVFARPSPIGTHYPHGIFLAGGPGLARGRRLDVQSIVDVAPTLLHALGLATPSDFDGRPIEAAFEPGHLVADPPRVGPPTRPVGVTPPVEGTGLDDEGEEIILNRLRDLGYID